MTNTATLTNQAAGNYTAAHEPTDDRLLVISTDCGYPDDRDGEHDHDACLDTAAEVFDTTTYLASEDWTPDAYDAALTEAGYRRISDWDTSNEDATCTVERA